MAKQNNEPIIQKLADQIRASEASRQPVETMLATDERVLARITDGIYRQPASALRELISNAYDADATEVIILTDAPRFAQISIRDNGLGLTPEVLEHLVKHIGGSVKRSDEGPALGVTSKTDSNRSPGGRQLIGKLGIGLFSVAQFTRHFLIITKTKGDSYRTIADITLGSVGGQQKLLPLKNGGPREIETGHARIWRERATEKDSHGTEIKLLDLLPRTRAELASYDLWAKIDFEKEDNEAEKTSPPTWHIGRMKPKQSELLESQSRLPWDEADQPEERFQNLLGRFGTRRLKLNLLTWMFFLTGIFKRFGRSHFPRRLNILKVIRLIWPLTMSFSSLNLKTVCEDRPSLSI
ncbi:MAG: ATP-binding protein [Verrucomicrobiota bacterium]